MVTTLSQEKQLNKNGNRRGLNPNSLKNLTHRIAKGETANPKGRPPKDVCLTSLVKEYMEQTPTEIDGKPNTKTWRELLAQAWILKSLKGDSVLFKELLDRLEGKVTQPIAGENGEPIRYEISVRDAETRQLTDHIIKGGSVVANISLS